MKKTLFLIGIFFLLAACGKKGPLIPPEAFVPVPIADLKTEQKGSGFLVCWSSPGKEESGKPLKNLGGFRIFKREVLPPDEDCEECPTAYRLLRTIDPEYLQDVYRSGSRYCFTDSDLVEGKTYQYKVVSLEKDGAASRDFEQGSSEISTASRGSEAKGRIFADRRTARMDNTAPAEIWDTGGIRHLLQADRRTDTSFCRERKAGAGQPF